LIIANKRGCATRPGCAPTPHPAGVSLFNLIANIPVKAHCANILTK
jgi:hypothetical protein